MTDYSQMRDLQRHLLKAGVEKTKVMGMLDEKKMIDFVEMYNNHADQMAKFNSFVIIFLCICVVPLTWYYLTTITRVLCILLVK